MKNFGILILAAGQGKRMLSPLPKVLHELGGESLIGHVLTQVCESFPHASIAVVVGHGREQVENKIKSHPRFSKLKIDFIFQSTQKGTGDAVRVAMESSWGQNRLKQNEDILVLPGDLPLVTIDMLQRISQPLGKAVLRLLTTSLQDPTGYGRVIRKGRAIQRIVEEKDLKEKEKSISEVAVSIYYFSSKFLFEGVRQLKPQNKQGEYYLTDVIFYAAKKKRAIADLFWKNSNDLRGVNDPWELTLASRMLNERVLQAWARKGVVFIDPASTWVDVGVELSSGVVIYPGVILKGTTKISSDTMIGPYSFLSDMTVGRGVYVKAGTVGEKSRIEDQAQVGPYAHLRPESIVGSAAKIGNFVELKKTRIGTNTSVAHLSYLGDAEVGKNVNIGCGFVTCNFDGRVIDGERKHKTVIEDDVFLGSDCQAVAPVRIGQGAYIASGSTITEDVPSGALAVARSRQINKEGYVKKIKGNS